VSPSKSDAPGSKTDATSNAISSFGSSDQAQCLTTELFGGPSKKSPGSETKTRNLTMKKTFPAVLLSVALLSACSKTATTDEKTAGGGHPTAGATTVAAADSSGVPECDDYVAKIKACIKDKIPAAQQGMMEQSLNQAKAGWATVSDKSQLAKSCKMMTDQAKAAYKSVGCDF
jgi:hypothetical protein